MNLIGNAVRQIIDSLKVLGLMGMAQFADTVSHLVLPCSAQIHDKRVRSSHFEGTNPSGS